MNTLGGLHPHASATLDMKRLLHKVLTEDESVASMLTFLKSINIKDAADKPAEALNDTQYSNCDASL